MHSTPATLLERLRRDTSPADWVRFVRLYTPLLFAWSRRLGLQESDAADLVQDVFLQLVRVLPGFQYDQHRSFRRWLHTMLLNKWRDRPRRPNAVPLDGQQIAADFQAVPDDVAERDYRQYLTGRALQLLQHEYATPTWKAFWEYVVQDRPGSEVAREMGMTVNSLYLIKSRILGRLRQELGGLWE